MIHTNMPWNFTVFFYVAKKHGQKFDSHKLPTVLVDEVKGRPRNFEAYLCRSLYSTLTTSF